MPRNTVNSRQTAKTPTATNDQGPSGSRRRPSSKRVSFADEQGDAAATIAQQKKEQEKIRIAQAKTKAAADRAALKEQKEATKRREKEEARRRKEQEEHVARLEAEVETLRREKELEEQRAAATRHEQELRAAAVRREEEERAAMQRGARMTTEELLNEAELREPYSPRTLAAMKRDEELKNGPYEYSVRAVLRVQNGSQTPTKWSNKIGGLHVKGRFDIHALNIDLDAAIEQHGVSELSEIRGWAKSTHSKGTRQTFTLDTISIEQWEQRVESITTAEWQKRPNFILDVELICTGRIGLRRGIQAVDGPAQSPSHRRTRTSNLEDQHAVVRDRQEALGDHLELLITRWKCQSTSCGYKGTCWIDENGEHHKMNAVTRERWAAAIQDGQATQYQPPLLVYKTFMNANSSASGDSQKKKTPMEQMKAMMEQQMELGLLKSMRSMANMASEESQPSHSQQFYQPPSYQLPSYQPPPPPIYPFSPPQYFGDYSQQQSIGAPPPPPPPPPAAEVSRTKTPPPQRSSPIDARTEEEDIIERFWQWKKEGTNKQARKLQICQVQAFVKQQMWGIDDMKALSDASTDIYKYAMSKDLPHGLLRDLKRDLSVFKALWRETYQHAYALERLGQRQGQSGGFD